jgi:hypothetical protein
MNENIEKGRTLIWRGIAPFLLFFLIGVGNSYANLIQNGDFEKIADSLPRKWSTYIYGSDESDVRFYSSNENPYSGKSCVTIKNIRPNDAKLIQRVEVKPQTLYKLSCRIRAENIGENAIGANISVLNVFAFSQDFKDTNGQWKYVELYGITGENQKELFAAVRVGGYGSLNTGKASFDDFRMEEANSLPAGVNVTKLCPEDVRPVNKQMTSSKIPFGLFYSLLFICIGLLIYKTISAIGIYIKRKIQPETPVLEKSSFYKKATLTVFAIAIILRIGLCIANDDWNDYHFGVIKIILNEERIPTIEDGGQCYHPKLYYITAAALLKILHINKEPIQIMSGQFVNGIAGIFTIYIVWLFLKERVLTDKIKFICFSLIALNPGLAGINSQITNDSFVILFVTAGIYFAYRFFNAPKPYNFIWLVIFSMLAALAKASGIILFFGLLIIFGLYVIFGSAISSTSRKTYLLYLILLILSYGIVVPYFGEYAQKYRKKGTPFAINSVPNPLPRFFKKEPYERPGVTSIADSYLTFRFFELLQFPKITNDVNVYPRHRTSLWSQLYGRTNFIYYDNWPVAWQTNNTILFDAGRIIFVLALLPSSLFIMALLKRIYLWFKTVFLLKWTIIAENNDWLFDVFLIGYISSIILFTMKYRDFCSMKAIYIFPALLPATVFLSEGILYIYKLREKKLFLISMLDSIFYSLMFLYSFTIASLIWKLW